MIENQWASLFGASEAHDITRYRIRAAIAAGEVRAMRLAGRTFVNIDDIERLAARLHGDLQLQSVG